MKKTLLVIACLFLLAGCGHVKLKNGENAIVTLEGVDDISSDDLYKELKNANGASTIMNLIDKRILNKLYKTTSEENKYISDAVKTAKKSAKDMNADFDAYLSYYYGISDEKAYEEYLSLDYKRNLWATDYSKESVTEKQLNEYYENEYFGDIDAKHILITVDVASDASSDDKTKAENAAFDKAVEIIDKLKKGENFDDLAKQYSQDKATASKGGSLGKINIGDYDEDVLNALNELEDGKYSTTPLKSTYGYHILYRISQDKKKELSEVTDTIKEIIGSELKEENGFNIKSLVALRKKYNLEFKDNELQKAYENLMTRYGA